MRPGTIAAALLVAAVLATSALAQSPADLFSWELAPASPERGTTVAPGDTLWLVASLTIAPDHYVYAERTSVAVEAPAGLRLGKIPAPQPRLAYDVFEGRQVAKYFEIARFRIPVIADRSLGDQTASLVVRMSHQGCSKKTCYFPTTVERSVRVTVRASERPAQAEQPQPAPAPAALVDYSQQGKSAGRPGAPASDLRGVLAEHGVLFALGLMFVGGLLTSFTPCVYPLIPITVSLFGASRASAPRGFALSLVFVLGMASMYSVLGVSAAATGAVFGSVMSNPAVIATIAAIFVLFAASMFGAFEIQLPTSFQTKLTRVGGAGFGGSFATGLVAGVIAAPCTGPVLGAALTYVATTGDLSFGFLAMLSFALGMGLLFVVIGTFSARIVPKSGPWLEKVKSVFGIAMVVTALYVLKDVVAPLKDVMRGGTTALVVSLVLVAAGLAAGAVHGRFIAGLDREGNPQPAPSALERLGKGIGILFVVAGLYGAIGFVLSPESAAHEADRRGLPRPAWMTDEPAALARALNEGKPVLIDAYADWCVACKELDRHTYSDPRVIERLRGFVAVKLDLTSPTDADRQLIRKYRLVGLPTLVVLNSRGVELPERRIVGFVPPAELLRRLDGVE